MDESKEIRTLPRDEIGFSPDDLRIHLVRWPLAHRGGMARWHVDAPIAADDRGRTQCGIRWPRTTGVLATVDEVDRAHVCENCLRALEKTSFGALSRAVKMWVDAGLMDKD